MEFTIFTEMLNDKHFFNLEKMQHKYGKEKVADMVYMLQYLGYKNVPVQDFNKSSCVYILTMVQDNPKAVKTLLNSNMMGNEHINSSTEDEIKATLEIENIYSTRDSIKNILKGLAPKNKLENNVFGIAGGLKFIADTSNKITEENLYKLYMLTVGNYLPLGEQLTKGMYYRDNTVQVVGDKVYHTGLNHNLLPQYMKSFINFINEQDDIPHLAKGAIIHFYFVYLHPYFDGNGRTARLLHLWYLIQQGYSATLFYSFSKYINASKNEYYKSIQLVEDNFKISKKIDITPFIAYFKEYVYSKIEQPPQLNPTFDSFKMHLEKGDITEKEKDLWSFVLFNYGQEFFSTKTLEKDFGNAAYATIRSFVLKFEKLGLLEGQVYTNKVKYRVKR